MLINVLHELNPVPNDETRIERDRIEKRRFRIKDIDQLKLVDDVFNEYTLKALYELMNRRIVLEVYGPIAQGKEAKVIWGKDYDGRDIALKVYYTLANRFINRDPYIMGDRRFTRKPSNPFKFASMWCRKEFRNMKRAYDAMVTVPKPIAFYSNILVMEFIGDEGVPAPTLKDAPPEDAQAAYIDVVLNVEKAFIAGRLIHADLSEYNILNWNNKLFIIDWGSAVDASHPNLVELLTRDIRAINRFFDRLGASTIDEGELVNALIRRSRGRYEFIDGRLMIDGEDLLSYLKFNV
jgi:RIO kinase 1